jgi:serine/threonine protein phosphatase PrpC
MTNRYEHSRASASSRLRNQDASGIYERDEVLVVVLADGGGGLRGGEAASRSLVAVVESAVNDPAFVLEEVRPWIDLFLATDAGLAANRAGETTGVVVVLGRRGFMGLSIGNSEAWVVTPTGVDKLTVGQHTHQRLGSKQAALAVFERPFLAGVLVVGTDGLFNYASTDVIAEIVRGAPAATAAERLLELVRLRSGKLADDVALVLVRPADASASAS